MELKLTRRNKIILAAFGAICLAMLIAGAVMLGIAIHEAAIHKHGPPSIPTTKRTTINPNVVCDMSKTSTTTIFLIDVAIPSNGTLKNKLECVRNYLLSIPEVINLSSNWTFSKLGIAIYYGNNAYLVNDELCSNDFCWKETVENLNEILNPHLILIHNATRGLQFIYEEFGKVYGQLQYGVGRNVIIISDGYEFSELNSASYYAKLLKNNLFTISSLIITESNAVANIFDNCSSNSYHFYNLQKIDQIQEQTIKYLSADWICRASIYTTLGPSTLPPRPTLETISPEPTTKGGQQPRAPLCQQYTDLVIIYHTSTASGWNILSGFIGEELIVTLLGSTTTSSMSPFNIAILTYSDSVVQQVVNMTDYKSASEYIELIKNVPYTNPTLAQYLSQAYRVAGDIFKEGRFYASKLIVVFTDYIDPADAEGSKKRFDSLPNSYVLAVQTATENQTLRVPSDQIIFVNRYSDLDVSSSKSMREYGNQIASLLCTFVTPTTRRPTKKPTTLPPPTPEPKAVEPREVWPDIAVLIDVSLGMTDRGFEAVRGFLQSTLLNYYSITPKNTRVSIAIFDQDITIKTRFNETSSYLDLEYALGPNLEFGERSRTQIRDLARALSVLSTTIYNETYSGYIPSKENFLWIFLTGSPSNDDFVEPLVKLQKMGIRTEAVGLGTEISDEHLSQFGYTSFQVSRWTDDTIGINEPSNSLPQRIFDDTTRRRTQPLHEINSDIYFVLDQSDGVSSDDFAQMVIFVKSFISRLTIKPLRCAISIVQFSSHIDGGLQRTADENVVQAYVSGLEYTNGEKRGSDLGVVSQNLANSYIKQMNRSVHIILLLGSSNSNGYEIVSQTLSPLGYVYAIGINPNIPYLSSIANENFRFSLSSSSRLQNWVEEIHGEREENNMTKFFMQFANVQEEYMQSHPLPLNELSADFVFAIDLTLLDNKTFQIVKDYIKNFTKQLDIGIEGSQIGAHCYTNQNAVEDGFHFNDAKSYADVERLVDELRLESNDVPLPSDIAGAFIDIADYILIPEKDWRRGPTYTIVLSTARSLLNNPGLTTEAKQKMFPKSQIFGLNMDGQDTENMGFLRQFAKDYYAVVDKVEDLSIYADFSIAMLDKIDRLYKTFKFPEPPELPYIAADFIFFIDTSSALTDVMFQKIQEFMINLMDRGTFLPDHSRLGVVCYNSYGIQYNSIIEPNKYIDKNNTMKDSIKEDILKLIYANDINYSNLTSAMEYIVNEGISFGLRTDVPVIITLFASSPRLSTNIPTKLREMFNAKRLSYAFQVTESSSELFDYIKLFIDPRDESNFQISTNFQDNNAYYYYISEGYQRWMTTFAK